ncbi:MAG: NADH-quinone oxidoreductase subunit NuoE [Syntrophobacterales bacterium]|jgi:NADH-quinone oxidoreductase subunit E|nr:NADH-quinone oxidoreductase subunit NuoE [Syntrophobacterales bacterium]
MLPEELRQQLQTRIKAADDPREQAVNVMFEVQRHYGYLTDEGLDEAAALLSMTPLELEELATFYDFIYREPVGRFVLHVCDGVVCWMFHEGSLFDYMCRKLGVCAGEVSADGMFTVLPTACIGYCDHAPAMVVNGQFYGDLTPERIDEILEQVKTQPCDIVLCR